ncbi:hypothetical protein OICFNHDK_0684 [Methylobacterium bullatum]|uniref:Uncharacterized protein n=1 Tax=Methylobacterium bullatum TaxID=570505 RepID=A0AAV4Z2D9_9HYPH|nr:hypothetical protein OICFNHDK_0684 [Methylobacterium bullatum]
MRRYANSASNAAMPCGHDLGVALLRDVHVGHAGRIDAIFRRWLCQEPYEARREEVGHCPLEDALGHHRYREHPELSRRQEVTAFLAVSGYAGLSRYTALGGQLTVFALPEMRD